jgi:uncharacterized membrane protein HdeD (DUF308 family)
MRFFARDLFKSGRRPAFAALPAVVAVLGVLALIAPLGAAEEPLSRVGVLLAVAGGLEVLHGVRRATPAAMRRAVASGVITCLMALLVIGAPFIAGTALVLFLAISFAADAIGYVRTAWRSKPGAGRRLSALAAFGDIAVAVALLLTRRFSVTWVVAVGSALRIFGIAWAMATSKVWGTGDAGRTLVDDLGLGDNPVAAAMSEEIAAEETARAPIDRRWTIAFIITLFAIHLARMNPDRTLLGLLSPAIAVTGDMVLAVLFFLTILVPATVSLRSSTRWLERIVWRRYLAGGDGEGGWRRSLATAWLRYRLRMGMRLREARFSVPVALGRGLVAGMPLAAVIAATVPVWGMSWFFDTENWASGIWNSWAETRTDLWREAMVQAIAGSQGGTASTFAVSPPGTASGDFSFIVIGDTGEGDASQHVLRDQLLEVAWREDVRFVAISSDVVYPNGSMNDYEAKFWLPFKGVRKPVYAIPGNHDWYDALEAFAATFFEADAASAAMHARVNADLRVTSSTDARIAGLIAEAARLRREYEVPTGLQRGPFFELQSERFALVAIDTGIVKKIDPAQQAWLESALKRAQGKLTMAIVGHPFYAGGHDQTADNEEFSRLKRLLLDHGVTIMMAGDTHDFEYYADPPAPGAPAVHYFVNGGGGAYLSFGTALQWPASPPTAEWAIYPDRQAVSRKLEARTPWWKRPAWWWTNRFDAWPFSAEWLSALFDYNVAPFFQSFVEVRVEPSAKRVRLLPYGIHGRLRWRDLSHSAHPVEAGAGDDSPVEWTVPMR